MIYFYRIFYSFLKIMLLMFKSILPKKLKAWLKLRTQAVEKTKRFKDTYWFHAASGEIEYCKSIIRLLKEQQPEAQIVVTYSSPSAEKLFHNITSYVDQFIPLGWDQPTAINELIDYLQPKVLLFSRTDLWPELITQAKKRNIRIGVISFNPRFDFINNLIRQTLLLQLDFISCIDENIKNQLLAIADFKNISVDGDTRFDQVFYRLAQPAKLSLTADSKILVCGSTWPEDEKVLFECFELLLAKNIKIILSPHEVQSDNISQLEKKINKIGLSSQKLSNEKNFLNIQLKHSVLIIDKIGYLADAYRYADLAFVGGSFSGSAKGKIHSVMEPLCSGLPVITGPSYKNNPEAVKYQGQYVFSANTAEEINATVHKLLKLSKDDLSKDEISSAMRKNLNASQRVLTRML